MTANSSRGGVRSHGPASQDALTSQESSRAQPLPRRQSQRAQTLGVLPESGGGAGPRPWAAWAACLPATPWQKLEGDGWGAGCNPGVQSLRAQAHMAFSSSEELRTPVTSKEPGTCGSHRTAIAETAGDHGGWGRGAGLLEAPTSVQLSGRTGVGERTPVPDPPACPGRGCAVQERGLPTRPVDEAPRPSGNEAVAFRGPRTLPPRAAGGSQAPRSLEDVETAPPQLNWGTGACPPRLARSPEIWGGARPAASPPLSA